MYTWPWVRPNRCGAQAAPGDHRVVQTLWFREQLQRHGQRTLGREELPGRGLGGGAGGVQPRYPQKG